jgi:hypothetical protein
MALEKTINLGNYGLELPNSYHKIDSIRIEDGRIDFIIKVFASKTARDQGANPLDYRGQSVEYNQLYRNHAGDDLIAKLYDYVKTVNPEYQTATLDV